MSATANGKSIIPVIDNVQPAASAGVVTRTLILNYTSGANSINYSGSAGITGILYAGGTALGGSALTLAVTNTNSSDGTIFPITSGVTFAASATTGAAFCVVIISRT